MSYGRLTIIGPFNGNADFSAPTSITYNLVNLIEGSFADVFAF